MRTFEGVTFSRRIFVFLLSSSLFLTAAALLVCGESYCVSSLRRPYVRTRGSTDFYYVFEK